MLGSNRKGHAWFRTALVPGLCNSVDVYAAEFTFYEVGE